MTTLEILKAARKKIATPENWLVGSLARDWEGSYTDPWESDACGWCSAGAILAVCGDCNRKYEIAYDTLCGFANTKILGRFNDSHTHAEVLAAFDAAIAKLESA